jgi:hypothetical protein
LARAPHSRPLTSAVRGLSSTDMVCTPRRIVDEWQLWNAYQTWSDTSLSASDWANIQEGMTRPVYEAVLEGTLVKSGPRYFDVGCGAGDGSPYQSDPAVPPARRQLSHQGDVPLPARAAVTALLQPRAFCRVGANRPVRTPARPKRQQIYGFQAFRCEPGCEPRTRNRALSLANYRAAPPIPV